MRGVKVPEEKLLTFHTAATAKMFHSNDTAPPPPGAIPEMFYALSYPDLSDVCDLTSNECK